MMRADDDGGNSRVGIEKDKRSSPHTHAAARLRGHKSLKLVDAEFWFIFSNSQRMSHNQSATELRPYPQFEPKSGVCTHSTPSKGAFFPSNQCKITVHSAPHHVGWCGDFHSNFEFQYCLKGSSRPTPQGHSESVIPSTESTRFFRGPLQNN